MERREAIESRLCPLHPAVGHGRHMTGQSGGVTSTPNPTPISQLTDLRPSSRSHARVGFTAEVPGGIIRGMMSSPSDFLGFREQRTQEGKERERRWDK